VLHAILWSSLIETMIQEIDGKEAKITKIIDKVLKQVFGAEATHLIYKHLEDNYSLEQDEIVDKIELFAKGLEEFLRSGAYVIERKILEDIYSNYGTLKLELERVHEDCDFVSQVKIMINSA
jgi:hypothetical protein